MQRTRDPDGIVSERLFKFFGRDIVRGEVADIAIVPIKPLMYIVHTGPLKFETIV